MDKNTSHKIIKDTLEGAFDKNKFLLFAKNLCNQIDESKAFQLSGVYIPDAFRGYVKSYERLGTFTDPEDKKIDVLIVYLQKETSLERARTAQRNFVARYLKDRDQKDAGLVAFVSPNSEDWRFSLIKMEYKFIEGKSGKVKVKEEFTPARRWSFLVGANENSHTAQSRLAPILQDDEHNPLIKDVEEAFNIEKVTKEFFEKYRDLFLRVKETLDDVVKKDSAIKKDFADKGVDTVEFAKKLLGQIVFLYFLQKKGWFGVERDEDWGFGPKNFLRRLFEKKHSDYKNFFNDILEPLFYEALARERDGDFYSRFNCKIPFLNGGLFDPLNNYDWVHTDILMPNDLFSNNRKTKEGDIGDGILDVFDRYNFTVKEDEPLEKEVAIDPETLGKVFENLLEVKDRKSKGTYYTPREIVHYMCVQSLISYLVTELSGKVSKEDLEQLIKYGETVGENEARVEEKGKETETYYYKLPEKIRANAKLIDEKLASIKVCDPAIGSGAFPVGMMTEIVRARNTLSSYFKDSDRTLYNFKRDCIQNSLYGVDVDPGAVEIAKLRLWLSLVVDEDDIKEIKPLPNLDYKIMQGNSLLEEFEGVRLFDEKLISTVNFDKGKQVANLKERQTILSAEYIKFHQANKLTAVRRDEIDEELKKLNVQIKRLEQSGRRVEESASLFDVYGDANKKSDELKKLHKEFFEATQKRKKDELKNRIEKLEWDLIEVTLKEQGKNAQLKKIEELKRANTKPFFLWKLHFSEIFQNGGFDVVIANPPYVSYGLRGGQKMTSEDKEILRNTFPNSAEYKISLYALFMDKAIQIAKVDGGVQTFIVPDSFLLGRYFSKIRECILRVSEINHILLLPYSVFDATVGFSVVYLFQRKRNVDEQHKVTTRFAEDNEVVRQGAFKHFSYPQSYFNKLKHNRFRLFFNQKSMALISKIEQETNELGEYMTGRTGVRSLIGQKNIIGKEKKSKTWQKGLISGGQIVKYKITYDGDFINIDPKLLNRGGWDYDIIHNPKLLLRQTGDSLTAAIDYDGLYHLNNIHSFAPNTKELDILYLMALINSKLFDFYYKSISLEANRAMAQTDIETLESLPVKKMGGDQQKPFVDIVKSVLKITEAKDYLESSSKQAEVHDYVKRLDRMIYKLYELTPDEIEMVEDFGKKTIKGL